MNDRRRPPLSLLERHATQAGERWALELQQAMRLQDRRPSGGWPGTVSEARARLIEQVLPQLSRDGSSQARNEDREHAARILYASARRTWLANCDREEER